MARYLFPLLILLNLFGCRPSSKGTDVITMSVLRGPSAIAFADWLRNPPSIEGKHIHVRVMDSPDLVQAALIKGETDIAVLPLISAVNLYNKGIPIRLAGCPIWGTLFMVEKATPKNQSLYLFGQGTTPEIIARNYLDERQLDYPLNYAFRTAGEIAQAILAGKVDRAILSEPFLSIVLRKDSCLRISADLNRLSEKDSVGFPQTAIVYTPSLNGMRQELEKALREVCEKTTQAPRETIHVLEEQGIFAPGSLTPESIERCRIHYLSATEAHTSIREFLELIQHYEPKAIGGRLPDASFIPTTP